MIRHSETAKMSRTSSFFTLGGQLASSGGRTLISDSLKLQLYQHRGQLNLLKVEVYLKPPHLNIALWEFVIWVTLLTTYKNEHAWTLGLKKHQMFLLNNFFRFILQETFFVYGAKGQISASVCGACNGAAVWHKKDPKIICFNSFSKFSPIILFPSSKNNSRLVGGSIHCVG